MSTAKKPAVRKAATRTGASPKGIVARDIMTPDVVSVPTTMSVRMLAATFRDNHITGAAVVNAAGKLIGAVSETDIVERDAQPRVRAIVVRPGPDEGRAFEDLSPQAVLEAEQIPDKATVADIFSPYVVTANPDTRLEELAAQMVRHRVHRLFIVDREKLAGIVSSMDVMRAVAGVHARARE